MSPIIYNQRRGVFKTWFTSDLLCRALNTRISLKRGPFKCLKWYRVKIKFNTLNYGNILKPLNVLLMRSAVFCYTRINKSSNQKTMAVLKCKHRRIVRYSTVMYQQLKLLLVTFTSEDEWIREKKIWNYDINSAFVLPTVTHACIYVVSSENSKPY